MKRVRKAFASGARVYPAGAELPDNHPAVKAAPGLFESVAGPAKSPSRKPKAKTKADDKATEKKDDGQDPEDDGDADGEA